MRLIEKSRKVVKETMDKVKAFSVSKYAKAKLLMTAVIIMGYSYMPVYATAEVTGMINNIYTLVVAIISAAGAVILAWGVFDFATAYQSHDSSQQTQGLKKVISGVLCICCGVVISLIRG